MKFAFALLGVILSAFGLILLARKWNIATFQYLAKGAVLALGVAVPFLWIYPSGSYTWAHVLFCAAQVVATFVLILGIVFIRFWRDPERPPVKDQRAVVSAADGEVIYITKIPHRTVPVVSKGGTDYTLNELTGVDLDRDDQGLVIIGIEMNIMNVHINRCPIEGAVKWVKQIPGKFFSLRKVEAPFLNTRCTTIISNHDLSVATVQIASRLVRRIDNYLLPGQNVCSGQRLGRIRFGSQVAVIIPDHKGVKIEAFVGQVTRAGISILARY